MIGRRDEAIVATKFGGAEIAESGDVVGAANGAPEYVRLSVDRSLRNLGTDHIDLYYQHRVDPRVPVEETFGAPGELVAAGKIRYLGISEASAGTVRRAHAGAPLSAVQTEYSLFSRQVKSNGVLTTARELGIGFVASSPLGRGFLTATKYLSLRRSTSIIPSGYYRRRNRSWTPTAGRTHREGEIPTTKGSSR